MDIEFFAAMLCAGSMYTNYNTVLRGCYKHAHRDARAAWLKLFGSNKYATTIHTISITCEYRLQVLLLKVNSGLVKLSKLTCVAEVYRGVRHDLLPEDVGRRASSMSRAALISPERPLRLTGTSPPTTLQTALPPEASSSLSRRKSSKMSRKLPKTRF